MGALAASFACTKRIPELGMFAPAGSWAHAAKGEERARLRQGRL